MTSRSEIRRPGLVERVLARSLEVGDCLEWQGALQKGKGTPVIQLNRRVISVRRAIAVELGRSVAGLVATYSCGNPLCVHPDHVVLMRRGSLSSRTGREMDRSSLAFRANMQRAVSHHKHVKLSHEKAAEIRARYGAGGVTQRQLAAEYGVNQYAIGSILQGKTWRDFSSPFGQILAFHGGRR